MNLIEQLGGYHNAKKFINGECADGFDVQNLRDALLEYRRQHKIYEVNDFVFLNVGSRVYKIEHIYKNVVWLDGGKESSDVVSIKDISRHATDEEIKNAGE